jgi:ribosomal protein L19E
VKKKVNKSKKEYVTVTRKLRGFLKHLSKRNLVDKEKYRETRKMIRAKRFRSKRHLKETLEEEQ